MKEELIKQIEALENNLNSNYALYIHGYQSAIFDVIEVIKNYKQIK